MRVGQTFSKLNVLTLHLCIVRSNVYIDSQHFHVKNLSISSPSFCPIQFYDAFVLVIVCWGEKRSKMMEKYDYKWNLTNFQSMLCVSVHLLLLSELLQQAGRRDTRQYIDLEHKKTVRNSCKLTISVQHIGENRIFRSNEPIWNRVIDAQRFKPSSI